MNWPGGNDPVGLKVKAEMGSVISAAHAYKVKYGDYPNSLNLLVPEFIASLPSQVALQYKKSEGVIGFIYSPSTSWGGVAKCATQMERVEWVCADYKI
jgi:hypothetical protein